MTGSHNALRTFEARQEAAGNVVAAAAGKVLVVSPHLDDAALGTGDLLASRPGACVLTVFAGAPQDGPLTAWDRPSGFDRAEEVIPARRQEDLLALFLLDALPLWLDFPDAPYAPRPGLQKIGDRLRTVIHAQQPDHVFFPLGLFHEDHRLASDASLALSRTLRGPRWIAYADALYRFLPGLVQRRVRQLRAAGWLLAALDPPPCHPGKRRAVECYESQLRALAATGHSAIERAFVPEAYWSVSSAS
jgi:LmbE family N-acetylglucosaminyl deacetylase